MNKRNTLLEKEQDKETVSEPAPTEYIENKNKLLISLLVCYACSQTSYLNVYALLPIYMKDNYDFDSLSTGILLRSY